MNFYFGRPDWHHPSKVVPYGAVDGFVPLHVRDHVIAIYQAQRVIKVSNVRLSRSSILEERHHQNFVEPIEERSGSVKEIFIKQERHYQVVLYR